MNNNKELPESTKPAQAACNLKTRQEIEAALLKKTQRAKNDTLMMRIDAAPVNDAMSDIEKLQSHAASMLKESQSRAASALKESQDTAASALKESQGNSDKELSNAQIAYAKTLKEKEQIIAWMTGGYSA